MICAALRIAQEIYPDLDKVVLDMNMLYNLQSRDAFCQFWQELYGTNGEVLETREGGGEVALQNQTPITPTATAYVAFLYRTGIADSLYLFTNVLIRGSRQHFLRVLADDTNFVSTYFPPTPPPTTSPTVSPTSSPTVSPSTSPTISPTTSPISSPTTSPTASPSESPTQSPTNPPPTESPSVSGEWYVDWDSETCKQSCVPAGSGSCGGLAEAQQTLFTDARSCCSKHLPYKNTDWCEGASIGGSVYEGTGKFYVDYAMSTCVRDCETNGPLDGDGDCKGIVTDSWVTLFPTIQGCCSAPLGWVSEGVCVGGLSEGTNEWYVDWFREKCVRDCIGPAPCGGLKNSWDEGYGTASADACCSATLHWLPREQCELQ